MELKQIIAENISALRREVGMTQAELAEKLLVSDKTISKWETAKGYPDISLLEPIAKTFGISTADTLTIRTTITKCTA